MYVAPPAPGNSRFPQPGEYFEGRQAEAKAFKNALASHRRRLDDKSQDLEAEERHNILVFHGSGYVGKSTLSVRLEEWVNRALPLLNGWGVPPATGVDVTVRFDLYQSKGQLDVAQLLVAIRIQLGKIKSHWPLFDVAFAAYWSSRNHGDELHVDKMPANYRSVAEEAVLDFIKDMIAAQAKEGIPGTPLGLGVRGLLPAIGFVRRRRRRRDAFESFEGYPELFSRCVFDFNGVKRTPNSWRTWLDF